MTERVGLLPKNFRNAIFQFYVQGYMTSVMSRLSLGGNRCLLSDQQKSRDFGILASNISSKIKPFDDFHPKEVKFAWRDVLLR